MATLTGTQIANTYKQLLQVGSSNTGLTGTVQSVQDGEGNNSPLQLSQSAVNINGTFQLSGVTLTANASTLNAVADLTGATGIVAVSGGNVYGRTITGGAGVSITNADGTEGNPTIALNTTGVTSASYGPATNIEVNSVGQIVSAGAATSVSVSGVTANTFTGGTFAGTTGDFSSNVSVGGNLVITGEFSPASLSVTGTINANKISATDATFNNIVSATYFVGDGSGLVNVPSAEGGTVKAITAGTGIKLTVDAAVTTTMPVSGTVAVSANQNFGTVSVSTALAVTGSALFGIVSATNIDTDELLIAGVSAATVTEVAAVSALTQTNLDSITSINTVVENVSAVTSVNAAAITSINTIIGDGSNFATSAELAATSLALATSIDTANTRITSVSDFAVALSATMATSIGTANTRITSVSDYAVALSATLATSIGNSNTNITTNANAITSINTVVANVSALTSVNAAAITSINTVLESDVSADSGTFNTLTVITSASVGGTFNVGGNVGIGTTSPAEKLEVTGNLMLDATDADIKIKSGGAGTTGAVRFTFNTDSTSYGDISLPYDTRASVGLLLNSIGSYPITIDSGNSVIFKEDNVETMRLTSTGRLGIGTSSPNRALGIVAANNVGGFESTVTDNIADQNLYANLIDYNLSGSDTTTTDRTHVGLRLDIDSSASGGDTSNEHRLYGIWNDIDVTEDSDLVYGTYNALRTTHSTGTITDMRAAYNIAEADGTGTVTNAYGSYNYALSGTTVSGLLNGYGSFNKYLKESADTSTLNNAHGVYAEVEIDAGTILTAYGVRSIIDRDGGTVSNGYLYHGQYTGTYASGTQWGVYLTGEQKNYFSGDVGIGTSSPAKQLHITKAAKADIGTLTDGATITPDFDANQNFSVTLGGNRTLANPSNIDAGQTGSIFVVQDGTGSRTLSFGSYWKFAGGTAPTLSTAAGSVDRIDYIVYTTTAIHAVATLNVS